MTLSVYGEVSFVAIDTPGTYSLNPKSPDEQVTFRALFEHPELKNPHVVVAVVDATLLTRQMLVVRQLQAAGFRVVVALTMIDLLHDKGLDFDLAVAEKLIGASVVPVDGRLGGGVKELVTRIASLMQLERQTAQPLTEWDEDQITRVFAEIDHLHREIVKKNISPAQILADRAVLTEKIDRVLLHPVGGLAIFLAMMSLLFTAIFWVAQPFMDFVSIIFLHLSEIVYGWGPGTLWADFLANGLIKGLGAVLVFVPQIAILFIGLIFLEDTGYLARAATLVDRPLAKLGLNGRSFVPLLSAYACAIPAMLSARTISSRRERWLTIFIIPLMTCSARLPVYALLLSFLFFGQPAWKGGVALAALYFASLIVGGVAALIASRILPPDAHSFFMLELPIYRAPKWRKVLRSTWDRTRSYVVRAGPTILLFSMILWVATTFPSYTLTDKSERLQHSMAASFGHILEPVMRPMGADWRVGVGLLSAFAAREVFVSSMAIVFNATTADATAASSSLLETMQKAVRGDGQPLFTAASVIALILFFMIALQCMSTVSVAFRESGRWQFAALQLILFNVVAYILAVTVYQGLSVIL